LVGTGILAAIPSLSVGHAMFVGHVSDLSLISSGSMAEQL